MQSLVLLIDTVLGIYIWLLIGSAILSWLVVFNVVNTRNQAVIAIGNFLYRITEPALRPIRRVLPNFGGIDISPVVLILLLMFLQNLLRESPGLSEERINQEVAILASRSDVREELDRLSSHIAAAHDLMREAVNIGRKLDFLIQEFNREANTLCSKSASGPLTATGLALKAAIEQLREQVQNIE